MTELLPRRAFLSACAAPLAVASAGTATALPASPRLSTPFIPTIDDTDPIAAYIHAYDEAFDARAALYLEWLAMCDGHDEPDDQSRSFVRNRLSPSGEALRDTEEAMIAAMHRRKLVAVIFNGCLYADHASSSFPDDDGVGDLMCLRLTFTDQEWAEDENGGGDDA